MNCRYRIHSASRPVVCRMESRETLSLTFDRISSRSRPVESVHGANEAIRRPGSETRGPTIGPGRMFQGRWRGPTIGVEASGPVPRGDRSQEQTAVPTNKFYCPEAGPLHKNRFATFIIEFATEFKLEGKAVLPASSTDTTSAKPPPREPWQGASAEPVAQESRPPADRDPLRGVFQQRPAPERKSGGQPGTKPDRENEANPDCKHQDKEPGAPSGIRGSEANRQQLRGRC